MLGMHFNISAKRAPANMIIQEDVLIEQWHKAREFAIQPARRIEESTYLAAFETFIAQTQFDLMDLIMLQPDFVEMFEFNAKHKPLGLSPYFSCICFILV